MWQVGIRGSEAGAELLGDAHHPPAASIITDPWPPRLSKPTPEAILSDDAGLTMSQVQAAFTTGGASDCCDKSIRAAGAGDPLRSSPARSAWPSPKSSTRRSARSSGWRRRPPPSAGVSSRGRHAARRGPVGRPPMPLPLDVLLADLVDIVPRCRTIYSCCRLVARAGAAHRRARRLAGGLSSRCWAGAPRNERRHSCAGWWMAAREGPRRAGRIAHEGRPPRRRSVGSARWRRGGCCASGLRV
jgi:hypothetical protein